MFSAEEAFMDMTHSQTINISRNTDASTGCDAPPAQEMNPLFPADSGAVGVAPKTNESRFGSKPLPTSRSADPLSDVRSICSKVPSLDPGFENFLAGLFKSSGPPSTGAEATSEETPKTGVDKENQAPHSAREGAVNVSRKRDSSRCGSAMTQAAHALPDDGCSSFPTKEFFPHSGATFPTFRSGGAAASLPARGTKGSVGSGEPRDKLG